jgi:hypothetical protein
LTRLSQRKKLILVFQKKECNFVVVGCAIMENELKQVAKTEYFKCKEIYEKMKNLGMGDTNNAKMYLAEATLNAGIYNNDLEMFKKGKENYKKYLSLVLKELEKDVEDGDMLEHRIKGEIQGYCQKEQLHSNMAKYIESKNNVYEEIGKSLSRQV